MTSHRRLRPTVSGRPRQGFAEHLSHDVNARLWTPLDEASFDQELETLMATKREGKWSPEAERRPLACGVFRAGMRKSIIPPWRTTMLSMPVHLLCSFDCHCMPALYRII